MSGKPSNPPAFPHKYIKHQVGGIRGSRSGMTLRDYFAAQALAGELASQGPDTGEWPDNHAEDLAKRCYLLADAMLKARAEETP